eukprot:PhF_6_TR19626/c0_g1_i1/m.28637
MIVQKYLQSCCDVGVKKPNTGVVKMLSLCTESTTELSFQGLLLGPKGTQAVIRVLSSFPNLEVLSLHGVNLYSMDWCSETLGNEVVGELLRELSDSCPKLRELDLRDNPLGTVAGRMLQVFVHNATLSSSSTLQSVLYDEDGVESSVVTSIQAMLGKKEEKRLLYNEALGKHRERVQSCIQTTRNQRLRQELTNAYRIHGHEVFQFVSTLPPTPVEKESLDDVQFYVSTEGELYIPSIQQRTSGGGGGVSSSPQWLSVVNQQIRMSLLEPKLRVELCRTFFPNEVESLRRVNDDEKFFVRLAMERDVLHVEPGEVIQLLSDVPSSWCCCVFRGCVIVEDKTTGFEVKDLERGDVYSVSEDAPTVLRARGEATVVILHNEDVM